MATQADSGIPFSISHQQEQFRLVELPADICTLLTSPQPPTLRFKSAPNGHTVLCTPNKTYQIRQVSTSNSVHILAPVSASDDTTQIPVDGISAIAKCDSTLEVLDSLAESSSAALAQLKTILPLYNADDVESLDAGHAPVVLLKEDVFADIPLSDGELERIWQDVGAFELSRERGCFRASEKMLAWATALIMSMAAANGIDFSVEVEVQTLERFLHSLKADELNASLAESILRRCGGERKGDKFMLDGERTAYAVGRILLEDMKKVSEKEFLTQWRDLLPAPWRGDAKMSVLEGLYTTAPGGVVRIAVPEPRREASSGQVGGNVAPGRDWHNRFKKARTR